MFLRRLFFLFFLPVLLLACDCGTSSGNDNLGDAGDHPTDPDAAHPDTGDHPEQCEGGTLCGNPAVCCAAGNECVSGRCLPSCESGTRCDADSTTCCATGELCIASACEAPGAPCGDSYDCDPGNFCEPTLGRCISQPPGGPTCEHRPSFGHLEPALERVYEGIESISIPVVANLDGKGAPEVVVNTTRSAGQSWTSGHLVVLDGASFEKRMPSVDPADCSNSIDEPDLGCFRTNGRSTIALADVSGDGLPDILFIGRDGKLRALDFNDGEPQLLWTSRNQADTAEFAIPSGTDTNGVITVANFDDDPRAEIIVRGHLFDHNGRLISAFAPGEGSNGGYDGGIPVVADLDGDGKPEIIAGRRAFKVDWQSGDPPNVNVSQYWAYTGPDGYPGVADMNLDGKPDVVLVASSHVVILDGQEGTVIAGPIAIPTTGCTGSCTANRGGPPTIADFDGDGRPEIGVAGGYSYSVYDFYRDEDEPIPPDVTPAPNLGELFVRWSRPTRDDSSNATGSSVFDFQGDGAAEVVYADECFLRVYSGVNGAVQLEWPNMSGTIHEYPLVVDADGDGNSEILVVANGGHSCDHSGYDPETIKTHGVFLYGDTHDLWVPTRRVWPQHTYAVTNATSAGNPPLVEEPNFSSPGLNNFRQNVQGEGVFNAPDLTVSLSVALDACWSGEHRLIARVTNLGSLGVHMGVPVLFERLLEDGSAEVLGTAFTTGPLLPGQSENVILDAPGLEGMQDYRVTVDLGSTSAEEVAECDEDNNTDEITEVSCFVIIGPG